MCTECIEQRLWARFGGGRRAQSHRFPTQPSLASHHTAMSSHRAGIAWPLCTMQSPRPSKCIHYPHGKIPWLEIDACCILCVCEVWLFPCLSIWMSCHDKSTLIVCTISALETQWRQLYCLCKLSGVILINFFKICKNLQFMHILEQHSFISIFSKIFYQFRNQVLRNGLHVRHFNAKPILNWPLSRWWWLTEPKTKRLKPSCILYFLFVFLFLTFCILVFLSLQSGTDLKLTIV